MRNKYEILERKSKGKISNVPSIVDRSCDYLISFPLMREYVVVGGVVRNLWIRARNL